MALKGTMLLNGADYAPFNLYGALLNKSNFC